MKELAAETGLLGFAVFCAIVLMITVRLWRLRARFMSRQPELANLATAFWFAIIAYLGTAAFLQLSYQRYMWMFFALGAAAVQVLMSTPDVELPVAEPDEQRDADRLQNAA